MKKKFVTVISAAAVAGMLAGCSGELSNEYVTVTQYKGLEVPQASGSVEEVTDEQVDQMIEGTLSAYAEREEVSDRAAQEGDIVNIDYTGYLDGEAFDGGSAEGADLELGSGSFIGATDDYAGFEEQIEGHNPGEEFDIQVQFPDPYNPNPDMSGAVADFHIVLNSIAVENVPELTDEWVKENSEDSETVEEYREEVRASLEEEQEAAIDSELASSVQSALLEKIEVKSYPEEEVNKQIKQLTDTYAQMAEMYGMEMDEFLETYMQMTEDDFNAQAKEAAQTSAAFDEAVKLIAKKQHLELSDEEYNEKALEYAQSAGMDDVEAYEEQVGEDLLKQVILREVVMDYLVDECIQVEQTDSSAE